MSAWGDKIKDAWWRFRRNRRAQIIVALSLVFVGLLGIGYGVWAYYYTPIATDEGFDNPGNTINFSVPDTGYRSIDGVEVPGSAVNLFPIAVMIENLVSIRPQAGLGQANLVYEALAEGGITRFMAIYAHQENIPKIGPVRSARHYFVEWAEEYHGIYSYVGGSPQALGITNSSDYIIDLNQFYSPSYYYRDEAIDAPHNLFSSSELLSYALRDHNLTDAAGDYTPYVFKANAEKNERPDSIQPIQINFSNADYQVEWRYDRSSNSYLRWNGGEPHLDANTSTQLSARNIIIQKVETSLIDPVTGRLDMVTEGEGEALLFQDGQTIPGYWVKDERGERTQFITLEREPMLFNRGVTWIEVVPTDRTVTY